MARGHVAWGALLLCVAGGVWWATRGAGGPGDTAGAPLPPAPAIDPLRAAREDLVQADARERMRGCRRAADLGDPALVPDLTRAFDGATKGQHLPGLAPADQELERKVRLAAAVAWMRTEGAQGEAATERFLNDADPLVRRAAFATCAARRWAPPAPVLNAALTGDELSQRLEAASLAGLMRVAETRAALRQALDRGDAAAPMALLALGRIGGEGIPALVGAAIVDARLRVPAERAAVELGATAVPVLAPLLQHADAEVRLVAARALAEIGGDGVARALAAAVTDADVQVRRAAAGGIAKAPDPADRGALVGALTREQDPGARGYLANALGRIGDAGTVRALAVVARGVGPEYAPAILEAVGRIGGPDARELLRSASARPEPGVQRGIAEALAARFDPTLAPLVTPCFGHADYTVRRAAARAAATAGAAMPEPWRAGCEALLTDNAEETRLLAAGALAAADPERAARAVLALNADPDAERRGRGWQCAARLTGAPGLAAVRTALDQPDALARRLGCEAAVAQGARDCAALIARELAPEHAADADRRLRLAAAKALGRLGARGDVAVLLPMVLDTDAEIARVAAEGVFRLLGVDEALLADPERRPFRLPHWAWRWWAANAGKRPGAWSAPTVPVVPSV